MTHIDVGFTRIWSWSPCPKLVILSWIFLIFFSNCVKCFLLNEAIFFFFLMLYLQLFFFFFFLFCQYIVCAWCKWLKNDCYPPLSQTRTSKKFSFLNQKLIIYKKILQALCLLLAVFIMRLDVSLRQQPVSWSALTQGLYTTSRLHNYLQRFHSLHFNPF